jgi:hypothetical protein
MAEALLSIVREPRYIKSIKKRPLLLRTDEGKEFLNSTFQKLLKREGIEFRTCRYPDVKCAIVTRTHFTIRDKIQKYHTNYNTFNSYTIGQNL